jgi:pimeloyl-ACP methyl ester carboxylesterase
MKFYQNISIDTRSYIIMKKRCVATANIVLLSLLLSSFGIIIISYFPLANTQPETQTLPVLLIHGYNSGPEVWNEWLPELEKEGIKAKAVHFPIDDDCGSSESHAQQLDIIVQRFKIETGADKINVVAHSKGGLDTRVYLSNELSNDDIANLIMIGTPNLGSPLATASLAVAAGSLTINPMMYPYLRAFFCLPALQDLVPGSPATEAEINENTQYFTIAGDWTPSFYYNFFYPFSDSDCPQPSWLPLQRWASDFLIFGGDDGIVPLWSAASQQFENIGVTDNCHTNLFEIDEYAIVKEILLP